MKLLTALSLLCIVSMQFIIVWFSLLELVFLVLHAALMSCVGNDDGNTEVDGSQPVYEGPTIIREGEPLRIVCKIGMREPFALEWLKDDMTINLLLENEYFIVDEFIEQDAALQSILNVRHAETWHSGHYRCNKFSSHGHLVVVLPADAEDGVQEKCFKTTEPFEMTCSGLSEKAEWVKEEGTLDPNAKIEVMDGHSVFKIEKAKLDHAGKYSCKEGASKQTFEAQLAATIHKFPASANIVEGEKYTLKCEVYGTLLDMEVKWYKDDEYINGTESNAEHRNMSVLSITEINAEHRGNYTCKASNRCGQASRSIYIRVVDKYAALWPFLGICAEVIVLCTVIFIYEKRRSKAEFDESDGEQNNDTKHVGNAKDSEVRQRK